MKKMIAVIIILLIIYISLVVVKKMNDENEKINYITVDEVLIIETYLEKIYMWEEVTKEAIPEFTSINHADELWIWNVVGKNITDQEIEYENIMGKAKELFGVEFEVVFPEEGGFNYIHDEDSYVLDNISLDAQKDCFYINKIEKDKNIYTVEIVEYLEDYDVTNTEDEYVYVKNTDREILGKVLLAEIANKGVEIIKENIDKCVVKKIILEKESNKIYIKSVDKIN